MKIMHPRPRRAMFALTAALFLGGCANLPPWFPGQQSQQYHPLDSEVAQMAAPQPPPPATPPLYCRIGRGDAHFAKGWAGYNEAFFSLEPDARVTVPIVERKGGGMAQVVGIFDTGGQKLIFCPMVDGPPDKRIACTSLYALDDDLTAGVKRTFDIPSALRGASITCAYRQDALQKL